MLCGTCQWNCLHLTLHCGKVCESGHKFFSVQDLSGPLPKFLMAFHLMTLCARVFVNGRGNLYRNLCGGRGQLLRIGFSFPPCGFQGPDSGRATLSSQHLFLLNHLTGPLIISNWVLPWWRHARGTVWTTEVLGNLLRLTYNHGLWAVFISVWGVLENMCVQIPSPDCVVHSIQLIDLGHRFNLVLQFFYTTFCILSNELKRCLKIYRMYWFCHIINFCFIPFILMIEVEI